MMGNTAVNNNNVNKNVNIAPAASTPSPAAGSASSSSSASGGSHSGSVLDAAALAAKPDGTPAMPMLAAMGFETTNLEAMKLPTGMSGGAQLYKEFLERIDLYEDTRNFPAVKGPSYLSTHLRFGTVSIRKLAREAWQRMQAGSRGAEVWLSELIWRDFYHQILHHHPRVVSHCFKRLTQIELSLGDSLHHLGQVSAQMQETAGVFA